MEKRIPLVRILLFITVLFGREACGIDLSQAHLLYNQQYSAVDPGSYSADGILFLVTSAEVEYRSEDQCEARGMFRVRDLLKDFVYKESGWVSVRPAECDRPGLYANLFKLLEEIEPGRNTPPLDINLSMRVLENRETDAGFYRYVEAVSLQDLESQVALLPRSSLSLEEVEALVRKLFSSAVESGDSGIISKYAEAVDCPLLLLDVANRTLLDDGWCLDSFMSGDLISVDEMSASLAAAHDFVSSSKRKLEAGKKLLLKARGFTPLFLSVADDFARSGQPMEAVNLRLLSGSIKKTSKYDSGSIHKAILGLYPDLAWTEFDSKILRELGAMPHGNVSESEKMDRLQKMIYKTQGFLNFPADSSASSSPHYQSALDQYRAKQPLDAIKQNLWGHLAQNPLHAEGWNLLGRVYLLDGNNLFSVACLHQSIRLDLKNAYAWVNLANVYQKMGARTISRGAAYTALMFNPDDRWVQSQVESILDAGHLKE